MPACESDARRAFAIDAAAGARALGACAQEATFTDLDVVTRRPWFNGGLPRGDLLEATVRIIGHRGGDVEREVRLLADRGQEIGRTADVFANARARGRLFIVAGRVQQGRLEEHIVKDGAFVGSGRVIVVAGVDVDDNDDRVYVLRFDGGHAATLVFAVPITHR